MVISPFSNSAVSSPRYQTVPALLGVPVQGVLDHLAVEGDGVAHYARGDAVGDLAGHRGGGDDDAHDLAVLGGLPVGPTGSRFLSGNQALVTSAVKSLGSSWTGSSD